jgi:hypothetical protein
MSAVRRKWLAQSARVAPMASRSSGVEIRYGSNSVPVPPEYLAKLGAGREKTVKSMQMISGIKVRMKTSGKLYKNNYNVFIGNFWCFVKEKGGIEI